MSFSLIKDSMKVLIQFLCGSGLENCLGKSLHFELLSLRVGRMCSDYLGHFAVEYIFSLKKKTKRSVLRSIHAVLRYASFIKYALS